MNPTATYMYQTCLNCYGYAPETRSGYCRACKPDLWGGASPACPSCGKFAIESIGNRKCFACTSRATDPIKPLLACSICATNVAITSAGLCATCYEPKPAAPPQPKPRPSWDDYFFEMARLVSRRATCPRASIGVVLVDGENRTLSTGYNGAKRGEPHCTDVGCTIFADHCVRATHAEVNAVEQFYFATGLLDGLRGATAYVVGPRPICSHCARELHTAGVFDVKWRDA